MITATRVHLVVVRRVVYSGLYPHPHLSYPTLSYPTENPLLNEIAVKLLIGGGSELRSGQPTDPNLKIVRIDDLIRFPLEQPPSPSPPPVLPHDGSRWPLVRPIGYDFPWTKTNGRSEGHSEGGK